MLSKSALTLAFLKVTAAQSSGYVYVGDSLRTATIAISALYILVIVATLTGSIIYTSKTATRRHLCNPYNVLSTTLLFAFVSLSFNLARLIMTANGGSNFGPPSAYPAVYGISEYVNSWTMSLLFLAFSLILSSIPNISTLETSNNDKYEDKSETISNCASKSITLLSVGYFVVLIVLASITAAFYISYNRAAYVVDKIIVADTLLQRALRYMDTSYVFNALLYATMPILAVIVSHQYRGMRSLGERMPPPPLRKIAFISFPLYALLILIQVTFTVVFSPSGLRPHGANASEAFARYLMQSEIASLTSSIFVWGFFSATCISLLIVGPHEKKGPTIDSHDMQQQELGYVA